ncbi:MAG TPA: hypothetical protein PKD78_00910 [Saprospiraceae bacterium]|nr:hypothetical protein [Saprospiraceae bacterium]
MIKILYCTGIGTLLLIPFLTIAQNDDKRDYIWVLGDPPNIPAQEFGGTMLDFHQSPPKVSFFNIQYPLTAISTISDAQGNLEFYSNACHLIGRDHAIMENGTPINPGYLFDNYCSQVGYPLMQVILSLPIPGQSGRYAVFHLRADHINSIFTVADLLYSEVETDGNGKSKAVKRNVPLAKGKFSDYITAVRHGNGRDWWVVVPNWQGTQYCTLLLTDHGVQGPFYQISQKPLERGYPGQIAFSPDGSWLADCRGDSTIRLARFDRCAGKFYDEQVFSIVSAISPAMGCAFSPNSRLLYVSTPEFIFQYDMSASNIRASKQIVAEYDGFTYNGPRTSFFQGMLAPDNKIYFTATNATWHLHIIHQPDSLGTACTVEQHALKLASKHSFCVPNFPYFRLYDLPGSVCDTLGINGPVSALPEPGLPVRQAITFYPNPSTGALYWSVAGSEAQRLLVYSATGQRVLEQTCTAAYADLSGLPDGLYWVLLLNEGGRELGRGRVLLLRE